MDAQAAVTRDAVGLDDPLVALTLGSIYAAAPTPPPKPRRPSPPAPRTPCRAGAPGAEGPREGDIAEGGRAKHWEHAAGGCGLGVVLGIEGDDALRTRARP